MKIIEFKNAEGDVLRGLYSTAEGDTAVVFLHGFERSSVEYKFKNILDKLKGSKHLFRFDFTGCGMSEGDFGLISAKRYAEEIDTALQTLQQEVPNIQKVHLVAHSFAGCAVLEYLSNYRNNVEKVVFFGPALNQKVLQRYWFVQNNYKGNKKDVSLGNYLDNFDEEKFQEVMKIEKRLSKAHYIYHTYFQENIEKDYQDLFPTISVELENMLIVHGTSDPAVPVESNDKLPEHIRVIKVTKGDHDLERMVMVQQYLEEVVTFLK